VGGPSSLVENPFFAEYPLSLLEGEWAARWPPRKENNNQQPTTNNQQPTNNQQLFFPG
jgi:hypothetical protein